MFAALYLVALLYVIFEVLQFCGTTMGGFPPRPLAAKKRAWSFAFFSPRALKKSHSISDGCCTPAWYIVPGDSFGTNPSRSVRLETVAGADFVVI